MDNLNQPKPGIDSRKSNVGEAASDLLHESKKLVNELYEEGLNKVNEAQKSAKEQTDEVLEKVRQNPLASVLIAAGVGFLLSSILRK